MISNESKEYGITAGCIVEACRGPNQFLSTPYVQENEQENVEWSCR